MYDNAEELNRLTRQADELQRKAQAITEGLREAEGNGTAADGLVRVTVVAGGTVRAAHIEARAMRMSSHDLAEAFVEAARRAGEDLARQVEAAMKDLLDEDLRAVLDGTTSPDEYARRLSASAERKIDDAAYELDRIRRQATQ
jgi:DNA-binding protein YbaB